MSQSRYIRQEALPMVGKAGQAALAKARVAIVGMGALGSVSADVLARSGVGFLRLIDNDCVALSNIQRSALYTEADAEAQAPKVQAAAKHLHAINSTLIIEPQAVSLLAKNAVVLLAEVDLVLDGTDNFAVRYLMNNAANTLGIPWFYTGVFGTQGMFMPILPKGPCFLCLAPEAPLPGSYSTCTTDGVLATTTRVAASLQATQAIRYVVEGPLAYERSLLLNTAPQNDDTLARATLLQFNVWDPQMEKILVEKDPCCPVCSF